MNCDLAIAYRVYPGISRQPAIHGQDKFKLAELALASFRRSLGGLRVKLWAILDGCPPEYEALFRKYFAADEVVIVHCDRIGNHATFGRQIDLLLAQNDAEFVYFAEDDYFYLPGALKEMTAFMRASNDVDFVTPYDHPDYYTLDFHPRRDAIRVHGARHWRGAVSTCLTFLARKASLQKAEKLFRTYTRRNYDASMWLGITRRGAYSPLRILHSLFSDLRIFGIYLKAWLHAPLQLLAGHRYSLWCPLPSLATHLESTRLAPVVGWEREFKRDEPQLRS